MDKILFRAWRHDHPWLRNMMIYDIQNAYDGFGVYSEEEGFSAGGAEQSFDDYFGTEWYTPEQYVGIQDKQGKNIYEGDFVLNEYPEATPSVQLIYIKKGVPYALGKVNNQAIIPAYYENYLTILGNIHEHLDLYKALYNKDNVTFEDVLRIKNQLNMA